MLNQEYILRDSGTGNFVLEHYSCDMYDYYDYHIIAERDTLVLLNDFSYEPRKKKSKLLAWCVIRIPLEVLDRLGLFMAEVRNTHCSAALTVEEYKVLEKAAANGGAYYSDEVLARLGETMIYAEGKLVCYANKAYLTLTDGNQFYRPTVNNDTLLKIYAELYFA